MKKSIILFAITVSTMSFSAFAGGIPNPAAKPIIATIAYQSVTRELMQALELNEYQFVQLRQLNKKYNEALLQSNSNKEMLQEEYVKAAAKILTSKQLASYVVLQNNQNLAVK